MTKRSKEVFAGTESELTSMTQGSRRAAPRRGRARHA